MASPYPSSPTSFKLIMVTAFHEMGGNVTHRVLDSHSQLIVTPFESTIATSLSSNVLAGPNHWLPQRYAYPEFGSEQIYDAEACYHAIVDHELKPYLRSRATSKFRDCGLEMDEAERIERFGYWYDGSGLDPYCPLRSKAIEAFFRSTFDTWTNFARTGKETHYVGYSPPIGLEADKLFSDFPDAHMIHVIRNPWSGYADTLTRPYPFPLERYCTMWNIVNMQAMVSREKHKGRFHIVRYEDMIEQGADVVLNPILEAIGLEPFAANSAFPSFNRKRLASVKPWGSIVSPTVEANVATANRLTTAQKDSVRVETWPVAAAYGYTTLPGMT